MQAELLDRPTTRRRRRRGAVRLGRILQRGRRLRRGQRGRARRRRGRGSHGDRRLIVKPGTVATLEDLAGHDDRREGQAPAEHRRDARHGRAGRGRGLRDGAARRLRPASSTSTLDGIVGFPGYESNEPGALERAGIDVRRCSTPPTTTSPARSACSTRTGSSSTTTRRPPRTSCGRRCAGSPTPIADPEAPRRRPSRSSRRAATRTSCPPEGETFRWTTEAASIAAATPTGTRLGVPDAGLLQAEVDAYAEVGLFGGDGARHRRPLRRRADRRRLRRQRPRHLAGLTRLRPDCGRTCDQIRT